MVHSEILDDEHEDTAAGFWRRASGFFASLGVRVGAVMTDNSACYRSRAFVEALGRVSSTGEPGANRPQTSGNEELFDRTLMTERAYARPYLSLRAPGRRRMWSPATTTISTGLIPLSAG